VKPTKSWKSLKSAGHAAGVNKKVALLIAIMTFISSAAARDVEGNCLRVDALAKHLGPRKK
jgi:hypothetical protein